MRVETTFWESGKGLRKESGEGREGGELEGVGYNK